MPTAVWSEKPYRWWARLLGVVALILAAGAGQAFAQASGNSTVSGTVVESGGVVPGAVITLTEAATSVVRSNTSNETGVFRFPNVPLGVYSLKVTLEGFKPITVDNFTVDAGAIRDLGKLALVPGSLAETVEVTADVTPVQVGTSVRQSSVTSDQLQNIPMKG